MSELPLILAEWESRKGSAVLSRRFAFDAYRQTRDFLDRLAEFSQASGKHPNTINFGTTYVNLTIEGEGDVPTAEGMALAEEIEAVFQSFVKGSV